MLGKPLESIGQFTASAADDLCDDGRGVIEPDLCRDASNVAEHSIHGFQEALHVFSVMELWIPYIAVRKSEYEILTLPFVSVFVECGRSKICLAFPGIVDQWDRALASAKIQVFLFGCYVLRNKTIRTIKIRDLFAQAPIDSFCSMSLFPGGLLVISEPFVDDWLKWIKLGAKGIL